MSLLQVRDLSVTFGAVRAVQHMNLDVEPGTLVGLIGSNGAGKTTLLDAITGFVPYTGSAVFNGTSLSGIAAHRRTALGMSRTWQTVELFGDLTVFENLRVAASGTRITAALRSFARPKRSADREYMTRILSELEVPDVLDRYPDELSAGERKLIGLARTMMSGPKLILADEPAAGLDSTESLRLGEHLLRMVRGGISIVLVDHDMGLVLGVCDDIYVLDHGELIASGKPSQIRQNPDVLQAYLGAAPTDAQTATEVAQ
jgi:branched-chain amino acid transport system ATP-binding protein